MINLINLLNSIVSSEYLMEFVNEFRWRDGMRIELKTSNNVKGRIDGCNKKKQEEFFLGNPERKDDNFCFEEKRKSTFLFHMKSTLQTFHREIARK
jgi:hypothetical protein